ncbi:hypothetical protein [Streptomyces sp. NPDC059909]|uniref:hypothetical protein n=1 Tax=Streptomyces sp. NPDC059909 TaxID=3346998 RepID=UPI003662602B
MVGTISGCGGATARNGEAAALAEEFERALHGGDTTAACTLLAPETHSELEESQRMKCSAALAREQLPEGGPVQHVDVYGRQALVVLRGDTLFLSRFGDGWRVVAAGCEAEPGKPYQCTIKGA